MKAPISRLANLALSTSASSSDLVIAARSSAPKVIKVDGKELYVTDAPKYTPPVNHRGLGTGVKEK